MVIFYVLSAQLYYKVREEERDGCSQEVKYQYQCISSIMH